MSNPNKCGDCKHKKSKDYRSGKRFYYCSIQRSMKTDNGLKKILLKNDACQYFNSDMFKEING